MKTFKQYFEEHCKVGKYFKPFNILQTKILKTLYLKYLNGKVENFNKRNITTMSELMMAYFENIPDVLNLLGSILCRQISDEKTLNYSDKDVDFWAYDLYNMLKRNNVVVESFVDSKNKWIQQGIDPTEVELAIDFYRGLKTRNIVKGPEADIGFWMSKSFEEFNSFINQFKNVKTKTQVKREIGQDAEKVFENDRAVVIVPNTHAASCKYGAGTKWCTTTKDSQHWDQYTKYNVKFYYILTKDKPKNDRYYKVAVAVYLGGELEVYDAIDDNISIDKFKGVIAEYNIPETIFTNIFDPKKYLERFDHTIDKNGYVSIHGDFNGSNLNLTILPWKFKKVSGNFHCANNILTTLKGSPQSVGGEFNCVRNELTSLEGAPQSVGGDFICNANHLTTLEGAPQKIGKGFYCAINNLTSLKGVPKTITGGFYCNNNKLTTLKNAPQIVDGDFDCSLNKLTSLNGAPQRVGGGFNCKNNTTTFTLNTILKHTDVKKEIRI